jgi:hypothetical protein
MEFGTARSILEKRKNLKEPETIKLVSKHESDLNNHQSNDSRKFKTLTHMNYNNFMKMES